MPSILGEEVLGRHVCDELPQIEVLFDPIPPHSVVGLVDLAKQIANRRVQNRIGLELVILRLEPELVLAQVITEVVAVEGLLHLVREEISGILTKRPREKVGVDRFDDRIDAMVDVVDEQPAEGHTRSRLPGPSKNAIVVTLGHERRLLPEIVEHQRLQSDEALTRGVAVEIDSQRRLRRVAADAAARTDGRVPHTEVPPLEVHHVVDVLAELRAKLVEVA